ncbi:hypothetical protein GQ43DRAFT_437175 [Delitschia confertaspora ATCC 74209]|uniref:Carboxymuconolactone decarboxylase-like domain-containing protein n=1 Tax=Delitschia confertaspora ATCC 74209 TaxID=1513339 RepID=A0A9P4JTG3_9PLEO|nr:hypothetical protein GQ43DRAFT_437175 [Delitschia confertaspora ATCC 74209]
MILYLHLGNTTLILDSITGKERELAVLATLSVMQAEYAVSSHTQTEQAAGLSKN